MHHPPRPTNRTGPGLTLRGPNRVTNDRWPTQSYLPAAQLIDVVRWRRWCHSPPGVRRRRWWSADQPGLLGWDPSGLENPTSSTRTDAMQAALVELTQSGDGAAAVTLLVQLRPGLLRLVRQLVAGPVPARSEAVAEVRSVFFEVLTGHSLERRPTSIAANLVLDTRQRLHRNQQPATPEQPSAAGWCDDVDQLTSLGAIRALQDAADSLAGSAESRALTLNLGYRAWVLEQSPSAIARDLDLGPQRVRTRLHRFRAAIRSHYEHLGDDRAAA